ncbi:Nitrogen permease regulator 3 [Rhodosporidiobolus nylandii]
MSSLLAVLLVAKSSLGASLVYAYPPEPHAVPRTHKPVYRATRKQSALYSGYTTSSDDSSASSGSSDDEDGGVDSKQYLGFPDGVLASLLSPSRELCDQPFELVVDHLAFVGHPVWLASDETARERPPASEKDDSSETDDGEGEEGSVGGRRGRSRSRRKYADLSDVGVEDGPPVLERDRTHSHNSLTGASRLISFNFLCVIDTPPDSHLSSHLEGYYKDVIIPMTANIKALEKKDLWLGKEAGRLRRAREAALEKDEDWSEYQHSLPSRFPLAAALNQLYTSLKADQLASVSLGGLPVQVLLRGELPVDDDEDRRARDAYLFGDGEHGDEPEHSSRSVSPGGNAYGKHRPPPLFSRMRRRPRVHFRPWETLLLLEDAKQLQRDVLEGSLLWRFLEICRPTLSFAEYETLLDLDTEDQMLEDVVDHLVHWKKARVIDLISLKGSYAVSPSFAVKRLPQLAGLFSATFPTLPPLPALLASLTPAEPYSTLIPFSQRAVYLSALIFLLRYEVAEKQRTYVRVVASEEIKTATAHHWGNLGGKSRSTAQASGSGAEDGTSSALSTSLSGASDHSFGGRSGRSRQSSKRDLDDARGMSIVGGDGVVGSPRDLLLSRSAQSGSALAAMSGEKLKKKALAGRSKGLSTATFSSHSERPEELSLDPSVIVEPGRPSLLESRWLSEMCRDKDKAVVEKFERIVRMLNGRHHLDEMRFRAQLSRKHLQLVLAAFEEHLVLFTHP